MSHLASIDATSFEGSRISGPEEHGRLLIDSLIKSEKLECATEKLVDLLQKK